jgi:hypothetical protein
MTDFLFATPSFISDMGRILDIGATMAAYNSSKTPEEIDREALCSDWAVVGSEIKWAAEQFVE